MCDQQRLRPACAYAQSDQSLCKSLEYSMTVKLLIEHHLEFLSLQGGCAGFSESTLIKIPHCWKSHVAVRISFLAMHKCSISVLLEVASHQNIKMPQHPSTHTWYAGQSVFFAAMSRMPDRLRSTLDEPLTGLVLSVPIRKLSIYDPVHEISNNVVCATGKASDQPAHTRSLIRAFASRLSNL